MIKHTDSLRSGLGAQHHAPSARAQIQRAKRASQTSRTAHHRNPIKQQELATKTPLALQTKPRMSAQEKERAKKRRELERKFNQGLFLAICGIVVALLLCFIGKGIGMGVHAVQTVMTEKVEYTPIVYDVSGYVFDGTDPYLILVNNNLLLAEGYEVETAVADDSTGKSLQAEAANAYRNMVAAAKQDDVSLVLCSGYRDVAYQSKLFDARKQKYLDEGYNEEDAYRLAKSVVAIPGGSEHATGLAADIVTEKYTNLDEGFAETQAFAWLSCYAAEYGFILRYPESSQSITGITYEPWHWRYVGAENAKAIKQSGVSLEEFIEKDGVIVTN